MANVLDATGLQINTQSDLVSIFTTGFQQIYGTDINLSSDSPDGQLMMLFIQEILDNLELQMQIYSSFDPDNAIGNTLDQRVAINGIQRQGATNTVTPITVVTSISVNLYGLDQTAQPVYTVSDSAGNLWNLQTTQLGVSTGTNIFNFQAAVPGAITTTPNTINVQVTVVLGVTSVNNPTTYTTLGINEESDIALKIRRARSVSLGGQGYLANLYAALANINGVSSVFIYENKSDVTDVDGVPSHSIWVILAGSGDPSEIANAIYVKRNAGCGMFGQQSFTVSQITGGSIIINWDNVETVNLFIKFTATSLNGTAPPAVSTIRATLPTVFTPGVFEEVNVNGLATLVQQIDPNTLVTLAGFTTGQTQIITLSGVAASGTFVLNYNGATSSAINWNDAIGTIQTKLQAMTGLTTATVTGSIASQTLTFSLTTIDSVQGLLYVTSNTLMTSVPAAITVTYNPGYTNTLTPSSKKFQFVVTSGDTIIVPIVISPASPTVAPLGTINFSGAGGYGTYAYSLSINNSGGSINATSGVYTAGSTPLVTDQITIKDVLGNTSTTSITVT